MCKIRFVRGMLGRRGIETILRNKTLKSAVAVLLVGGISLGVVKRKNKCVKAINTETKK